MHRTAAFVAVLAALVVALQLAPSCVKLLDSQGDHPSAEEVRLLEEKRRYENWTAEADPAKREEMRRRHQDVSKRLMELHKEKERRYEEGR